MGAAVGTFDVGAVGTGDNSIVGSSVGVTEYIQ